MAELLEAERNGELTIRPTNVIVSAPVVRWPTEYLGWPEQDRKAMRRRRSNEDAFPRPPPTDGDYPAWMDRNSQWAQISVLGCVLEIGIDYVVGVLDGQAGSGRAYVLE